MNDGFTEAKEAVKALADYSKREDERFRLADLRIREMQQVPANACELSAECVLSTKQERG